MLGRLGSRTFGTSTRTESKPTSRLPVGIPGTVNGDADVLRPSGHNFSGTKQKQSMEGGFWTRRRGVHSDAVDPILSASKRMVVYPTIVTKDFPKHKFLPLGALVPFEIV